MFQKNSRATRFARIFSTFICRTLENNRSKMPGALSPVQTMEQNWIQRATFLDVTVQVEAKHYPKLLDETESWREHFNEM